MVGYQKNDPLTVNEKLIAGCLAGVVTRFVTQPLDIIKLRTQLSKKKKHWPKNRSMFSFYTKILGEEGLSAFWQGHILGQVHSVLSVSTQFYVYELTTRYAASLELPDNYRPYLRFICGVAAGCASTTLVIPLEVIRIRQMLIKDQYGGMIKGARAVYRYGGILAFYEGLSASLLQMGPQVGISFLVFSQLQPWILRVCEPEKKEYQDFKADSVLYASSIAGCVAGFLSKTLTYPLDLAKRRLQIGSHKKSSNYKVPSTAKRLIQCTSLSNCIVKTVQKQGIFGLFQGWVITVCKAQVTSVVAFTAYELICFAIRRTTHKT